MGEHPSVISALNSFMVVGNREEKKEVAKTLVPVREFLENRERAIWSGSVPVLIGASDLGIEEAVEVLEILTMCSVGREVMGRNDGCVRVLVKVLRNADRKGGRCAFLTLYSLSCHHDIVREEVRRLEDLKNILQKAAAEWKLEKFARGFALLLQGNSN